MEESARTINDNSGVFVTCNTFNMYGAEGGLNIETLAMAYAFIVQNRLTGAFKTFCERPVSGLVEVNGQKY